MTNYSLGVMVTCDMISKMTLRRNKYSLIHIVHAHIVIKNSNYIVFALTFKYWWIPLHQYWFYCVNENCSVNLELTHMCKSFALTLVCKPLVFTHVCKSLAPMQCLSLSENDSYMYTSTERTMIGTWLDVLYLLNCCVLPSIGILLSLSPLSDLAMIVCEI
jgi:hypothetical protein